MKKLLSLLLAAGLLVTMSACQNEAAKEEPKELTPFEVYTLVNETSEDYSSVEMNMDMFATISAAGQSMEMTMNGVVREVIRSKTDMDMEMLLDMSLMGMTIETSTYYKDGYMYQSAMGTQYKVETPIDTMLEQLESAGGMGEVEIPEEAVKNIEMTRTEDNGYILNFDLDSAFMQETIDSLMAASMGGILGQADTDMNITDIKYTLTADENYNMRSTDMEFSMEMEMQGEKAAMDFVISMEVASVNSIDAIAFPDDLDSYPEVSPEQAGLAA